MIYGSRLRVHGSRLEKKLEKIVAFILKGGEWRKYKDTIALGKIFPLSTLRFLPGIILSVNWLKIKDRLSFGRCRGARTAASTKNKKFVVNLIV